MRNFKLTLAYDGSAFKGWQRQPGQRTVQDTVEQAVRRVVRHQVHVFGAGRTDAGVHAAGQVANVYSLTVMPAQTAFHAIGARLPKDCTLIHLDEVPLSFHATVSAVSKLYRYRVFNAPARPVETLASSFVYHFWHPLDVEAMRDAARHLVGTLDFSAFASRGNKRTHCVRTVLRLDIYRVGLEVRFDVIGTGFLYNQVRNMVGTLIEVGRGHWPSEQVRAIRDSLDRTQAGPTAPARGLCMQWVRYDLPGLPPDPPAEPVAAAESPRLQSSLEPVMPPGTELEEEPSG